jgi:hypothetical protein
MLPSHHVASRNRQRGRGLFRGGRAGERGAVVVHVAVAMFGLLAFSALTIDLGTLWVARGEAQNVADAAALSGAVSMLAVDMSTEDGRNTVRAAAEAVAGQHRIWGDPVDLARSVQVTAGPGVCPGVASDCVNVVVTRGPDVGAPLPVFFSRLFGISANRVAAHASARASAGNSTRCPSPVAIPDSWRDTFPSPASSTWTEDDTYDRYIDAGFSTPPANADVYEPPTATGTGTGLTLGNIGDALRWERQPMQGEPLRAWQFVTLDFSEPGSSADVQLSRYQAAFQDCNAPTLSIGDRVPIFFGGLSGIRQPFRDAFLADPAADVRDGQVVNSEFATSPRLLTIALFDPDDFARQTRCREGCRVDVVIRNFVNVFVTQELVHPLQGILLKGRGTFNGGADVVDSRAAFLNSIALVR